MFKILNISVIYKTVMGRTENITIRTVISVILNFKILYCKNLFINKKC